MHAEGYGVFYFMGGAAGEGGMRFCTTCYAPRSAAAFNGAIEAALLHVRRVLEAEQGAADATKG